MDRLNTTIDSIGNLRKWVCFDEQFLPTVVEHRRRNDSQFSNSREQLWGTERVLRHLSSSTLEAHWPLLQELVCVLGRAITLVKEVCFKSKDSTSRREHDTGEHYLEVFLDLRWWTWVLICNTPFRTACHGESLFVTPKGVLDPSSSRLPSFMQKLYLWWRNSDGYARHLPSYGIELFLQETERLSRLLVWLKTESVKPLDKFDITRNICSASAEIFIIEGKVLVPVLDAGKPSWVGNELKVDLTQVVLGMSSSGLVIKCKDPGTEYWYALKRVQNLDQRQPVIARLCHPLILQLMSYWREDQRQPVIARLCHPHIVQLMSYWRENDFLFLMMEFMEGDFEDLIKRRLRVKKSPFVMNVVLDILLQIAKAMLYLHDMGLTHPHLKSSDVLFKEAADRSKLDKNDTKYLVKLGDFRFYSKKDFKSMAQRNVYQFGLICLEVLSTEPLHWELEDRVMGKSEEPKLQFNKIQNRHGYAIPGSLTQCITKCLDGSIKFSEVVVMLLLAQLQVLMRATKETSPSSLDSEQTLLAKHQGMLSSPEPSSRFTMITEMSVENAIERSKAHSSQLTRVLDASDFDDEEVGEEVVEVGKGTSVQDEIEQLRERLSELVEHRIIAVPHNLQILKSIKIDSRKLDGEGMGQLMKYFQDSPSVLEELDFGFITSDAQLEHISAMLATSTSLKTLAVHTYFTGVEKKTFTRGFTSIAVALCSNQSLESLSCRISSSTELKVLLDPLMPKNNNLQPNTTLTKLTLWGSIGGKEGIETLVDMLCTNTSLLELTLNYMVDFLSYGEEGIENVLAVLEALKANKSLTRIGVEGCKGVGGSKVLGAMMDLLLENHCIEDIDLQDTGLMMTGDADYVYSALSKRKKVRVWDTVEGMTNVNPTFGRVFLCGNPYAGCQLAMGDPLFAPTLVGAIVSLLLNEVIDAAKGAIRIEKSCKALKVKVDKIVPLLKVVEENSIIWEQAHFNWLLEFNAILINAQSVLEECLKDSQGRTWMRLMKVWEWKDMPFRLKQINDQIDEARLNAILATLGVNIQSLNSNKK